METTVAVEQAAKAETPYGQYQRALRGEFAVGDWVKDKDLGLFMGQVLVVGVMNGNIPALRMQGIRTEFLLPISQAVMLGFGKYWEVEASN